MSSGDTPRTKFFQACRGVFEGGGCRGAAHIGAYEIAVKSGVNFSEVAGTSAGSIIAALVGAGASPEFLLERCAFLRFGDLLAKPKGSIETVWWTRALGPFLRGRNRIIGRILRSGSAYSSERLEQWLDDLLGELLPQAARPVRFKDLVLPTYILATDLGGRRPKTWSTQGTPLEEVATAVRASCSIPLFFEPVESGNNMLVDGGMLSNLPTFVFADREASALSVGGRILGFRLVAAEEATLERTFPWLFNHLIDASISGATEIQGSLQNNVSIVSIPTGGVSSINFDISRDEVELLLSNGRAAMTDFIRDEDSRLHDLVAQDIARYGEDELYDDLAREMAVPGKRLIVVCESGNDSTRWFWDLFPSVAHCE